jgi:hypothetical protein
MHLHQEPNLNTIDDYNNQESKHKRQSIRFIIIGLIVFATLLGYIQMNNDTISDYIGTPSSPGIEVLPYH